MQCPNCNSIAYLYEERYEDGTHKIICNRCGWKTEAIKHIEEKIGTWSEKKRIWE